MTPQPQLAPLGGCIKQRIADFIVEEEYVDNQVARVLAFGAEAVKTPVEKHWVENTQDHAQLHVVLEKYQYDVPTAIRTLTRYLGVSRTRVGYAGLKDKRGITAQRISLFKPDLARLQSFDSRFLDLRPITWSNQKIELGDLVANHFTVTIRDLSHSEEDIRAMITSFIKKSQNGLPNYFGEQRFGGKEGCTHQVGKLLIHNQTKEAVLLYVGKPLGDENEEAFQERKSLLDQGNFLEVLKRIPIRYRFERSMLAHLHKRPQDWVGAFQCLPKSMRYLFVHAYQSHLFNRMIDWRLAHDQGFLPQEGDRVENGQVLLPLIGYETPRITGKAGEAVEYVLESEGVKRESFKVHSFPEVSARGQWREMSIVPKDFKLVSIQDDAFNEGKKAAVVSFTLSKGQYATTVLDELMGLGH